MTKEELARQNKKLLVALEFVSEQIAAWSLNKGPLDFGNGSISNHQQREVERLDLVLEEAIVFAGGNW